MHAECWGCHNRNRSNPNRYYGELQEAPTIQPGLSTRLCGLSEAAIIVNSTRSLRSALMFVSDSCCVALVPIATTTIARQCLSTAYNVPGV